MYTASAPMGRDGGAPKLRVRTGAGLSPGSAYDLSDGALLGLPPDYSLVAMEVVRALMRSREVRVHLCPRRATRSIISRSLRLAFFIATTS